MVVFARHATTSALPFPASPPSVVNDSRPISYPSAQAASRPRRSSMTAVRRHAGVRRRVRSRRRRGRRPRSPAARARRADPADQPHRRVRAPAARTRLGAACKAASAANGRPFGNFDNLRVPGRGRPGPAGHPGRQAVQRRPAGVRRAGPGPRPTGRPPRSTAGQTLAIRYATTIPHKGKFRVYLTKAGLRPGQAAAAGTTWAPSRSSPPPTRRCATARTGSAASCPRTAAGGTCSTWSGRPPPRRTRTTRARTCRQAGRRGRRPRRRPRPARPAPQASRVAGARARSPRPAETAGPASGAGRARRRGVVAHPRQRPSNTWAWGSRSSARR